MIRDYSNKCFSGVQEKDSQVYVNAHFFLIGYILYLLAKVIFLIGCFIISINSSVESLTSTGPSHRYIDHYINITRGPMVL